MYMYILVRFHPVFLEVLCMLIWTELHVHFSKTGLWIQSQFLQEYNWYILASQFVRNVKQAHCTKADLFHPTILVDKTYMKLHTEIYKLFEKLH